MSAYLWTSLVICGLSAIGQLMWLAKGEFPRRTAKTTALDLAGNVLLLIWVALLLFRQ